ncbi:hypothetical protein ASZ90_001245 [hydrocarbon metagenome]|uniref:Inner membrane protein n=1 Tax=hydrocarbon metagenome TaxID=938273 RepID=A0A0W8G6Y8_9ZZZZ
MAETNTAQQSDIVVDRATSSFSDFWKKEDYWAIWLGFLILAVGLVIYLNNKPKDMDEVFAKADVVMQEEAAKAPFKTVAWHEAKAKKGGVKGSGTDIGKALNSFLASPKGWSSNPLDSLMLSKEQAEAISAKNTPAYEEAMAATKTAKDEALAAQSAAETAGFKNEELNTAAEAKITLWLKAKEKESKAKAKAQTKPYNLIPSLLGLMVLCGLLFAAGAFFMGKDVKGFLVAFPAVFVVGVISYILAGQATMKTWGVEYAIWAIAIGMIISNTVGTPKWIKPALEVEYFIKTGLVLLGAEVLFNKIVAIGIPGIFVAWVVTPIVLISTFIFGQKVLKMPSKTLNMVISADMSVCGTSAAIATAAACKAKKEELTLAIGLSLVFTSVMMIVMPAIIKAVGMPFILGGAWMGGTIDSTGAVAAAGAFLSEKALYVAATIKMIQNVLIGVTAFGVAVYWCAKVDCVPGQRVRWTEIWHRFPKFVLGFLTASIIFSSIVSGLGADAGNTVVDQGVLRGFSGHFRGWFFCFSFAAIGLATNFRELAHHFKGGKPLILYVCGQTFNLILTLAMAYVMFYLVFPEITAKI